MDSNIKDILYRGTTTIPVFYYDNLLAPPIAAFLSIFDLQSLYDIATDIKLSGDINKKYALIDHIMHQRQFARLAGGTNRLVYKHLECTNVVFKVAIDSEGLRSNLDEFKNQELIKPFCCKIFEVDPSGIVESAERVDNITTRYEFASIADEIYDMITKVLVGKYVIQDIGTNFFMNWGVRKGFGPVLLDFPYIYELDGSKIICKNERKEIRPGYICNGEIDYDPGFNFLTCKRCGRVYQASDLSKPSKVSGLYIKIRKRGNTRMKIAIMKGNRVIKESDTMDATQMCSAPRTTVRQITTGDPDYTTVTACGVSGKKPMRVVREEYKSMHHAGIEMKDDQYLDSNPVGSKIFNTSAVAGYRKEEPIVSRYYYPTSNRDDSIINTGVDNAIVTDKGSAPEPKEDNVAPMDVIVKAALETTDTTKTGRDLRNDLILTSALTNTKEEDTVQAGNIVDTEENDKNAFVPESKDDEEVVETVDDVETIGESSDDEEPADEEDGEIEVFSEDNGFTDSSSKEEDTTNLSGF